MSKVFFFENFFDEVKVKVLFATRKSQGTIESDLYHSIYPCWIFIKYIYTFTKEQEEVYPTIFDSSSMMLLNSVSQPNNISQIIYYPFFL